MGLSDAQVKESASVQENDVEPHHVEDNAESNPLRIIVILVCFFIQ